MANPTEELENGVSESPLLPLDAEFVLSFSLSSHIPPPNILFVSCSQDLLFWAKPQAGIHPSVWVSGSWILEVYFWKQLFSPCMTAPFYVLPHEVICGSTGFTTPLWHALETWYTAPDERPQLASSRQEAVEILHIKVLKHKVMWSVNFLLGCCSKHWQEEDRTHFCNDLIALNTKKDGMSSWRGCIQQQWI